jgi:hypothetical protein
MCFHGFLPVWWAILASEHYGSFERIIVLRRVVADTGFQAAASYDLRMPAWERAP